MKKNKNLHRAWFWSYVVLIFGGTVAALLAIKFSMALAIIFIVLACLNLGGIIAAQVLYSKERKLFPIFGSAAQGMLTLLILIGLIMEIVLSAQGKPAVYAWVVVGIAIPIMVFIDAETFIIVKKIIKGEKIIEGKQ